MKKALPVSPPSAGIMPPLLVKKPSDTSSPTQIQTFMLKKVPASSTEDLSPDPKPASNMRFIKTPDGKSFLFTNVETSQAPPNKPIVVMTQSAFNKLGSKADSSKMKLAVEQTSVSPVKSSNLTRTIVLNTEKSPTATPEKNAVPPINQPIVLQIPGINQPVVVKHFPSDPPKDTCTNNTNEESSKSVAKNCSSTTTPTTSTCTTDSITPAAGTVGTNDSITATGIVSANDSITPTGTVSTIDSITPSVSTTHTVSTSHNSSPTYITTSKNTENNHTAIFTTASTCNPESTTSNSKTPVVQLHPSASIISNKFVPTSAIPGTQPNSKNPIMYLKSGNSTYKVRGKPVPIKLFPKIAPKDGVQKVPIPPLKKPTSNGFQPLSAFSTGVSKPPAYLNIRIKEELKTNEQQKNMDEEKNAIKEENENDGVVMGIESMLQVNIKEEPKDDLTGELLARDEQLRQVLGMTDSDKDHATQRPKFFIRTSEGKLVTISPDEAEALGLNHHDKVEDNQKKLMNALSFFKGTSAGKAIGNTGKSNNLVQDGNLQIPESVNVKEFVSCHVSPAAEQNAAIMKTLGSKRLEMKNTSQVVPVSNTAIIGEFNHPDRRFLRVRLEMGPTKDAVCDVTITPLNIYQCPFCIKEFKTKDHILSHLRIHTGERPYPCEVCGKRYRQRIDIIRHMRIHTGEKPFTCGLCDASFNQKSNLRSHMRIHTGERPVQCNVCGKGFSRNTHLKQHMKLHTGEKPYQCQVCYRPFRFKSGLQAHERIHTGLKPYACSLCGRTFTQIVGLLRHERTHVGEKPFRCQSCGKSFNNREHLKLHVLKHTSVRPYACDMCDKTFTDKTSLRCHCKKYHSENLICMICLREDFKDRIELREHLREHERANWTELPTGELVPIVRNYDTDNIIGIDDTLEDMEDVDRDEESIPIENMSPVKVQVEVDLDPDDPMEDDDGHNEIENDDEQDEISDYEEHEIQLVGDDPLA